MTSMLRGLRTDRHALRDGLPALAVAALAILAGATPARAEAGPLPDWHRAAYKTLTFQAAAALADVALFGVIFAAGAGTGAAFAVANTTTATALYYPYELAWDRLGPAPAATTPETQATKAVGYQILTSIRNLGLTYAFTGALLPSAGFVAAAFAVDTALYVGNDVVWDTIQPRTDPAVTAAL